MGDHLGGDIGIIFDNILKSVYPWVYAYAKCVSEQTKVDPGLKKLRTFYKR